MKKTIVSIIAMLTAMTHSYGGDEMQSIKLQMLDSEIEKLTQERDTKYEELKKCEKTTKGFKIAGITTLSLTAVGVAANIGEAHKIKENKGIIISNDATIKAKEEAIREEEERKRQEKAEEERILAAQQNGQSGQNGGTEVVASEEETDENNPTNNNSNTNTESSSSNSSANTNNVDADIVCTKAYSKDSDGRCDYYDGDWHSGQETSKCSGLGERQWKVECNNNIVVIGSAGCTPVSEFYSGEMLGHDCYCFLWGNNEYWLFWDDKFKDTFLTTDRDKKDHCEEPTGCAHECANSMLTLRFDLLKKRN